MVFPIAILSSIALLCSTAFAAPIDGLTVRGPKVIGLDFDVLKASTSQNETAVLKRSGTDNSQLLNKDYYYITYLNVGSDKQKIGVDIDTGSSDLWIPSSSVTSGATEYGSYNPSSSSTSKKTDLEFSISYGDGSKSTGVYYTDTVSLANGVAPVKDFQFALVDQTSVQQAGILGIGLTSLEAPVVYGYGSEYNNFPVALKNAGYIDKVAYSLYLDSKDATTGSLLFGGKDTAKFKGDLVKLEHSGDANRLDVTLDSVTLGGKKISVNTPVNLDSGTTITYLPSEVVSNIINQLGGSPSEGTVPCDTTGSISYNFNGVTIEVPLADIIENDQGTCALEIAPGDGLLGDNFLRYAYLVYDLEDSSISVAQAVYTSDSNVVAL